MKTIKMKSISSGPEGTMHPNVKYTLDEKEAKELVDGGYAEYETAMMPSKVVEKAGKSPDVDAIKKVAAEEAKPVVQPVWGNK